jgi:hypothetical protein
MLLVGMFDRAQVMLLRNMIDRKLCNGSRGVVRRFTAEGLPVVKFVEGGQELVIERHEWQYYRGPGADSARRTQIPLDLAWVRNAPFLTSCAGPS